MKRAGFKPQAPPRRPERQWTGHTPDVRSAACRMADGVARMSVPVPKTKPTRDEAYRRFVASLPCAHCRIEGYSQAAHPNTGKAKGMKADDRLCFPLCCDRPGVKGCHAMFDQHQLFPREQRADVEREWALLTQEKLKQAEESA